MKVRDTTTGEEWEFDGNAWTLGCLTRAEGLNESGNPFAWPSGKWMSWRAGWLAEAKKRESREDPRACTCHPDDNPPVPCPKKYALQDCIAAAKQSSGN